MKRWSCENASLKFPKLSNLKFLPFPFGKSKRLFFNFLFFNDPFTMGKTLLDGNRDGSLFLNFIFFLQWLISDNLSFFHKFHKILFVLYIFILLYYFALPVLFIYLIIHYFLRLLLLIIFHPLTVTTRTLLTTCLLTLNHLLVI